jgi:hypothetical protein
MPLGPNLLGWGLALGAVAVSPLFGLLGYALGQVRSLRRRVEELEVDVRRLGPGESRGP